MNEKEIRAANRASVVAATVTVAVSVRTLHCAK